MTTKPPKNSNGSTPSPAHSDELREARIANDRCPECNGELDTGWECNDCGFDAMPEKMKRTRE